MKRGISHKNANLFAGGKINHNKGGGEIEMHNIYPLYLFIFLLQHFLPFTVYIINYNLYKSHEIGISEM